MFGGYLSTKKLDRMLVCVGRGEGEEGGGGRRGIPLMSLFQGGHDNTPQRVILTWVLSKE